ncbi:MAG TPA: ribosome biogenesis GTPase Der [Burkholderiales bacterium]|nr:ribosome biogenesis GTPase Der [Burkholderiales bacterium]
MKPTLVLVGRTNVGKSTLFNRLTRSRDAIVANVPGLTRDRHYGHGKVGIKPFLVVDTGGFEPAAKNGISGQMTKQTLQAIAEGDKILFMVDARQGLRANDMLIAENLRKSGRPVWLVVNKAEGIRRDVAAAEFFELGIGEPLPISAVHGEGVSELIELVLADVTATQGPEAQRRHPKIAIVGRPNAGKSTLVNWLLGEERVIVFSEPGTTRDSIYVDFEHDGKSYTLIDTAGLRKRGKVSETAEKFSTIKAMQAVEDADVVVLLLDAQRGISEQDAHIAGFILEAGRALVLAANKWDGLSVEQRARIKYEIARKLGFLDFAKVHYISALEGKGVWALLKSVDEAYRAAMTKLPTPKLTRALHSAIAKHQPPRAGLIRPKLRYAHQGGSNPPLVIVHGNALSQVPDSYRRYLESALRKVFKLQGTPLRVQFKSGRNPYAGK